VIRRLSIRIAILLAFACAAPPSFAQQAIYRWVDNDGIVRYGDRIPAEFANQDRDVLNQQGVQVGFVEGEVTEEERAELNRLAAIEQEVQRIRSDAARRDRILLDTYLTVRDIEDLRDRRLELIASQIRVTEFYLSNLRRRHESLARESRRFAPLSDREEAPPIPESLVLDISRTEASISLYEQTLNRSRTDQISLRNAFDLDIDRFSVLKGV
jgi:hypothetical protein